MKKLKLIELEMEILGTNCYMVVSGSNAIIIDPGQGLHIIEAAIGKYKIKNFAVLLTHGHFDHALSCEQLRRMGATIYVHECDAEKLHSKKNLSYMVGMPFEYVQEYRTFKEGILTLFDIQIEIIHTPGHSAGSCCFVIGKWIFTGDTILDGTTGRTDLYDGSDTQMQQSLTKLAPVLQRKGIIIKDGH